MGRPSGSRTQKRQLATTLRLELQRQIECGRCAYCRSPARPDRPLTREHVIPRARGGGRKDVRIIVPACARCNHSRGCADLIPFLLARPDRISSFIDYLGDLTPDSIREIDLRIFAELYTAVAILHECASHGSLWKAELARLCSGRSLHRRRYAARRAVGSVANRLGSMRAQGVSGPGPSCPVPISRVHLPSLRIEEPFERLVSRLLSLFAIVWEVPAEVVQREIGRELSGSAMKGEGLLAPPDVESATREDGILTLDGWAIRARRKRLRIDRRGGRTARAQRQTGSMRGRAA